MMFGIYDVWQPVYDDEIDCIQYIPSGDRQVTFTVHPMGSINSL